MIEYRRADAADARDVAQLHARSWRENYRGSFTDAFLDGDLVAERLAVWEQRLAEPAANQLVLLAREGADLAGFVCVYGAHDPEWGSFIDNLHVARDAKRGGIGSTLLRESGAWLGLHHPGLGIHLWVLAANTPARRFYERLGGRNAEETTMETHGGAIVRSCRYVWPDPEHLARGRR